MRKYILILLTVLVLLLVVGCGPTEVKQEIENYKVGTKEVKLNFLDNSPPKEVYQNSNFKVTVEVENQAAYDVSDLKLTLAGALDQYLLFNDDTKEVEGVDGNGLLQGRSFTNPIGERAFVQFDATTKDLFLNADEQVLNFFAKVGYKSTFEFSDTVCINPNLYDVYDSGCSVKSKSNYFGQGAPVSVSNMEQIIIPGSGGKVEFRLKLKDKGKGRVQSIDLKSAKLGGKDIRCGFKSSESNFPGSPHWEVKDATEAILNCEALLDTHNSYLTTLFMDFDYGYVSSKKHSLKLIR
jgi:hypothetical protein